MNYRFDPELAGILHLLPPAGLENVGVEGLPAFRAEGQQWAAGLPPVDTTGVQVNEREIPGPAGAGDVRVRVYRPEGAHSPAPGVLNIHGGGFVLGNLDLDHDVNVGIVRSLGVVVVSVDYRLAPEHPFPAGLEDCYAALVWMDKNTAELGVDAARIAVHGYSAGGGLSAAVALLARDRGGPRLCFQFLAAPELDDRLQTTSMQRFTDTPLWNRPNAIVSWDAYLGAGVRGGTDVFPYAAPARATDLTGLPPAYVSVMEFDPLRDEGIAYAQALLAAGVSVELHLFAGAFHGSGMFKDTAPAQRERAEEIDVLRRAFGL